MYKNFRSVLIILGLLSLTTLTACDLLREASGITKSDNTPVKKPNEAQKLERNSPITMRVSDTVTFNLTERSNSTIMLRFNGYINKLSENKYIVSFGSTINKERINYFTVSVGTDLFLEGSNFTILELNPDLNSISISIK